MIAQRASALRVLPVPGEGSPEPLGLRETPVRDVHGIFLPKNILNENLLYLP